MMLLALGLFQTIYLIVCLLINEVTLYLPPSKTGAFLSFVVS